MANAIVSFGVQKLWDLVSQEYHRLQGVGEQITELKSDLNMLMSFLSDAAGAKNQTSALARNCIEEIKEITYDAEDIIETFLVKEQRNGSGMKNHMRSLACIQGGRRKTALEITSISKRISKVINVMQTFGIKSDIMNGGCSQALLDKRETRHTFSSEPETNLIGLEEKVENLVGLLVGNDCSHGVSITGLGGLGKTTLARQVFNHDKVKRHFDDRLAWVCVSQDFTPKVVWQTILRNLSHGDSVAGMNEDELQKELVHLLQTKKALIVFDDVWKKEDWDKIKPMFPERKEAGWKVLLTSRNDAIHPQCVTFKPELLNDDECWTLLQMIAFPKSDTIERELMEADRDAMMVDIGELIHPPGSNTRGRLNPKVVGSNARGRLNPEELLEDGCTRAGKFFSLKVDLGFFAAASRSEAISLPGTSPACGMVSSFLPWRFMAGTGFAIN